MSQGISTGESKELQYKKTNILMSNCLSNKIYVYGILLALPGVLCIENAMNIEIQ